MSFSMSADTNRAYTPTSVPDTESTNGSIVKSEKEQSPPPDGGLRAWLVVLATHLTVMNTWGIISVSNPGFTFGYSKESVLILQGQ